MGQRTKKLGILSAAVVLALGTLAFPQGAEASTALSGTGSAGTAKATGTSSTAIGDNAEASEKYSIAVGDGATAGGTDPTAEQKELGDEKGGTIAIGAGAEAQGNYSTAIGYKAETTSTGRKGVAIGHQVTVSGDSAIGIGQHMEVGGEETVAIGYGVSTGVQTSAGITYAKGVTGIGSRSMAFADFSTALGYGTYATAEGSVALGSRAKTGFWYNDGTTETYFGGGAASIAQGYFSNAVGDYSVAIGASAMAGGFLGQDSETYEITVSSYAVALGYGAAAAANNSTAIGHSALVTVLSEGSTAIGYGAYVGRTPTETVLYANAIGYEAQAQQNGAFAIGYQALAATQQTVENETTGAEASSGAIVSTVSFGHTKDDKKYVYSADQQTYIEGDAYGTTALSRLTNIAVGKSDTDAVNFGQIKIEAPSGTTHLTSSLNTDGITLNEKGTIGANLIALDSAIVALETDVTSLKTNVGNIQTTIGHVKLNTTGLEFDFSDGKTEDTGTISYTDGNGNAQTFDITIKGISAGGSGGTTYTAGNGIKIENNTISVKTDGKVEAGNTGIVTGGTVYDALKNMDNQVSELSDDIHKVGAGAAALAALRPEAFDPADKWSFAVGYGHYKNANAGALGAFFKPNADMTVSIGGTIGNGDPMLNAGLSFKLGQRSAKLPQNATNPQLVQEVNTLRAQNATQQQEISAQRQEITSLRADNQRMRQQIEMILSKLDMSGKVSRTVK